jgi:hypothetical protein
MTTKRKIVLAVLAVVLILVALDVYLSFATPAFRSAMRVGSASRH